MAERAGSARPLGAVLAGGESTRMGADKALLEWRGGTLLERAGNVLGDVLPEVVIVGGEAERYGFTGLPVVPDRRPGLGPLGGLATALAVAGGRAVVALACDLPRVEPALIELILATAGQVQPDLPRAWVLRADDRMQPLCGFYASACGGLLDDYLAAGERRAIEFLDRLETTVIEIDRRHPLYRPDLFANMNRPGDLERLGERPGVGTGFSR